MRLARLCYDCGAKIDDREYRALARLVEAMQLRNFGAGLALAGLAAALEDARVVFDMGDGDGE
jgi:hypothetical protein